MVLRARSPGPDPRGQLRASLGAPAGSRNCKLLKGLVGERGFEPPTPWSRTMKLQTPSALSGVASGAVHRFSLAQLYRSCTEEDDARSDEFARCPRCNNLRSMDRLSLIYSSMIAVPDG